MVRSTRDASEFAEPNSQHCHKKTITQGDDKMKLSRNKRLFFSGIMALTTATFFAFQDQSLAIAGYPNEFDVPQGSGCINTSCPIPVVSLVAPNSGINWEWTRICVYNPTTNALLPNGTGPVACNSFYNGGCCNSIDAASKCNIYSIKPCPPTGTPPPPPTPVTP